MLDIINVSLYNNKRQLDNGEKSITKCSKNNLKKLLTNYKRKLIIKAVKLIK